MSSLVGKTFNRLTVLSLSETKKNRKRYYTCQCTCGNIKEIQSTRLVSGHTKSCGCLHKERIKEVHCIDISGHRYGRLTVLNTFERRKRNTFWEVICDCGIRKQVNYIHLVEGRTKSCGCIKRELMSSKSGDKSHLWRSGFSSVYPKDWNNTLKEEIRNRDNRKCQFPNCSYTDMKELKRLDVHHIDGNKSDCRPINLISLCHPHHMRVEMSARTWEDYFYSIVSDYEFR